jgi:hypothetical protein
VAIKSTEQQAALHTAVTRNYRSRRMKQRGGHP